MALFVSLVLFSIVRVIPSEKEGGDATIHSIVLLIQLAQLVTAFFAFNKQNAPHKDGKQE
jgi:hypothetical protein